MSNGFGGGEKSQWLLIGALGILIVGSIVTGVISFMGPSDSRSDAAKSIPVQCVKCGEKFIPDERQRIALTAVLDNNGQAKPAGLDCPKCSAKGAVYWMIRCAKCNELFQQKWVTEDKVPTSEEIMDRTCPKCGFNSGASAAAARKNAP